MSSLCYTPLAVAYVSGCYGVPQEEEIVRDDNSDLSSFTTVPWFCDACKAGVSSSLCVSSYTNTHTLCVSGQLHNNDCRHVSSVLPLVVCSNKLYMEG